MGDLFWNKVAGAVLAILLVVMGLREIGAIAFDVEGPETLGFPVDPALLEGPATAEEEESGPVDFGALLATASVEAGERVARRCVACHTFDQGGANGTGPNMWGVLGRAVASVPGFNYSSAMAAGLDPRPFVIVVMIGASAAFATPIGYQTNTLVYGPGHYRFTDYVKLGLPLNLIVMISPNPLVSRFSRLLMNTQPGRRPAEAF